MTDREALVERALDRAEERLGMAITLYGQVATDPAPWMDEAMESIREARAALAVVEAEQVAPRALGGDANRDYAGAFVDYDELAGRETESAQEALLDAMRAEIDRLRRENLQLRRVDGVGQLFSAPPREAQPEPQSVAEAREVFVEIAARVSPGAQEFFMDALDALIAAVRAQERDSKVGQA